MKDISIKSVLKNPYIFSLFSKVFLVIVGIINAAIINRFLGPSLKGEYAYILNTLSIICLVANLGIYQNYPFYKRQGIKNVKQIFANLVFIQFVVYLIIAIFLSIFSINNYINIIIFTLVPIMTLNNQVIFISLVESPNKRNTFILIGETIYTLMVVIVFYTRSRNYLDILILLYIKDIINIIIFVHFYKLYPRLSILKDKSIYILFFDAIKKGLFPMLTMFLITLNYKADIFILKFYLPFNEIGIYSVGILLAEKSWIITDACKDVLFSKTSKGDSIVQIVRIIKLNLYISGFLFLVIAIFGKSIIHIMFGNEFISAYKVTVIIFLGNFGMVFYKLIYTLFISVGRRTSNFIFMFICVCANILLNFITVPKIGIIGSALSSAVSYNLCGFLFFLYFKKHYDIKLIDALLLKKEDLSILKTFQSKLKKI